MGQQQPRSNRLRPEDGSVFPARTARAFRLLLELSRELRAAATGDRPPRAAKQQAMQKLEAVTGSAPNPEFITDNGTEVCIVCGADTGVAADLDISQRHGYVHGLGQCCTGCAALWKQ